MSILARTLFYLSKTDRRLILPCSDVAHKTQLGYGVFVLIVGIFAFTSASFALRTTVNGDRVVYLIAAVYATLIMFIDREIVSATNKTGGLLTTRLALAVFIGLVVSVPIELRIFEKQINQQLRLTQNANNSPYLARKEQAQAQYRNRILVLEQRIREIEGESSQLESRLTNELLSADQQIKAVEPGTRNPGAGPVYHRIQLQIQEKQNELARTRADIAKLQTEEPLELKRIEQEFRRQEIPDADDLLSRYTALGAVKQDPKRGWDAWMMAWGIRLLLIMLELTPALIKILQEENEYDALLKATRRRSITRIYAIANDHMDQLSQNAGQNPRPTLMEQLETEPLRS